MKSWFLIYSTVQQGLHDFSGTNDVQHCGQHGVSSEVNMSSEYMSMIMKFPFNTTEEIYMTFQFVNTNWQ